jgi:hypothetical protein
VSSSPVTNRAIAGTSVPDADAMMIIARRTRTDPCLPRRTTTSEIHRYKANATGKRTQAHRT